MWKITLIAEDEKMTIFCENMWDMQPETFIQELFDDRCDFEIISVDKVKEI